MASTDYRLSLWNGAPTPTRCSYPGIVARLAKALTRSPMSCVHGFAQMFRGRENSLPHRPPKVPGVAVRHVGNHTFDQARLWVDAEALLPTSTGRRSPWAGSWLVPQRYFRYAMGYERTVGGPAGTAEVRQSSAAARDSSGLESALGQERVFVVPNNGAHTWLQRGIDYVEAARDSGMEWKPGWSSCGSAGSPAYHRYDGELWGLRATGHLRLGLGICDE